MNKKYEDLYMEKIKIHFLAHASEEAYANLRKALRDDPKKEAEARRYLLVNGWMPYTSKNIKGLDEFYIDAEHLPRRIRRTILKSAFSPEGQLDVTDAEVDSEETIRVFGAGRAKLEGAWIKDGEPDGFKIYVESTVRLGTTFNFPKKTE